MGASPKMRYITAKTPESPSEIFITYSDGSVTRNGKSIYRMRYVDQETAQAIIRRKKDRGVRLDDIKTYFLNHILYQKEAGGKEYLSHGEVTDKTSFDRQPLEEKVTNTGEVNIQVKRDQSDDDFFNDLGL